jgi:hypothetical protein
MDGMEGRTIGSLFMRQQDKPWNIEYATLLAFVTTA